MLEQAGNKTQGPSILNTADSESWVQKALFIEKSEFSCINLGAKIEKACQVNGISPALRLQGAGPVSAENNSSLKMVTDCSSLSNVFYFRLQIEKLHIKLVEL